MVECMDLGLRTSTLCATFKKSMHAELIPRSGPACHRACSGGDALASPSRTSAWVQHSCGGAQPGTPDAVAAAPAAQGWLSVGDALVLYTAGHGASTTALP